MAFRFASMLKLRQSLEHQQELRVRTANQWVARLREQIRLGEIQRTTLIAAQRRDLQHGATAAEVHFQNFHGAELETRLRELGKQLAQSERARDQQQQLLFRVRQQREMLESLMHAENREHARRALRHEQRQIDEAFLMQDFRRGLRQNDPTVDEEMPEE